jgi:BolA family transcriptional regulator, general stress-responsive regulator
MNTVQQIHDKIAALLPLRVEIQDESAKHAGHAGAASGGGHYHLTIDADAFAGLNRVSRHRMIYDCLGDLMQHRIHALSIDAQTPAERAGKNHVQ